MTQPYVLDTSALMAHFLNEPGWEIKSFFHPKLTQLNPKSISNRVSRGAGLGNPAYKL